MVICLRSSVGYQFVQSDEIRDVIRPHARNIVWLLLEPHVARKLPTFSGRFKYSYRFNRIEFMPVASKVNQLMFSISNFSPFGLWFMLHTFILLLHIFI